MLQRLPNPFRNLANPREVWAWGMFDLANQSFTLLINTLFFPIFFRAVIAQDNDIGDRWWAVGVATSLGIVVILSPIIGAVADCLAVKKTLLIIFGAICAALTCAFALLPDERIWIALALYIPANVAYALGENFLAAFLPEISKRETMGRVSGIGWTMGYVGALILLGASLALMFAFNLKTPHDWRPFFAFAGVWFIVMATPTILLLRERAEPVPGMTVRHAAAAGFRRLADTIRAAGQYRHLLRFLIAFLVYGFGVQVIIFFSMIIADDFGFQDAHKVILTLVLTVVAGIAAVGTSAYQDRLGHRRTVSVFLVLWTINAAGLVVLALMKQYAGGALPQWPMWLVGVGLGAGLGGIGTSSRALVGALTPAHKTAEFFGLWGLTYKLAGMIGVLSFGLIKAAFGEVASLILLASFFGVGFLILLTVNEARGVKAATDEEDAERIRRKKTCPACGHSLAHVGTATCPNCNA